MLPSSALLPHNRGAGHAHMEFQPFVFAWVRSSKGDQIELIAIFLLLGSLVISLHIQYQLSSSYFSLVGNLQGPEWKPFCLVGSYFVD